jgi:hypothetical protein
MRYGAVSAGVGGRIKALIPAFEHEQGFNSNVMQIVHIPGAAAGLIRHHIAVQISHCSTYGERPKPSSRLLILPFGDHAGAGPGAP